VSRMCNSAETINFLPQYRDRPADFFIDRLPAYASENGRFIQVKRAFHEILGYPVGIHAGRYRESILGVHLMSLVNALRQLEQEGKVERRGHGIWIWKENGGENGGE